MKIPKEFQTLTDEEALKLFANFTPEQKEVCKNKSEELFNEMKKFFIKNNLDLDVSLYLSYEIVTLIKHISKLSNDKELSFNE